MSEEVVVEKKKGSMMLVIVAVLLVVVLIAGGLLIWLLAGSGDEEEAQADTSAPAAVQDKKQKRTASSGGDFSNLGSIYPLDAFTVNIQGDGVSRYLKCTMQLEQNIPTLTPELDKKQPIIRDIIIRTLMSKTQEEISTSKGQERLKDEILNRLNEILQDGYIKNIFFTDFIIS